MGGQTPMNNDRARTYWTPTMERYFIDLMLDQMHRGNRMGHTFNKQAWADMLTMFNANFGSQYDKDVLKSRYTSLWMQFNDIKNLLDQSGFYWDDTRQMVIADEYVWDTYVKAHPDAQYYKNKVLMNFNDLCLIYAYTTADGRYSRSSHDIDFDDDIQGLIIGDGMGSLVPASNERPKPDWTPVMDRYFVKLMLDQVRKGHKINDTFTKQAWTDMLALFNAKFCSQHGKRVLRHRYKKLRKYYRDVRSLLEHDGFLWDKTRQTIAADDYVWDNYIKAHPHAQSYRKKTLLKYQDLGLIYGNEITNGICSHSYQDKDFEYDIFQLKTGEGEEGQTPTGSDSLRTYWTVPMDRYLIDLLLDQALRGNKIGDAFINQAWIEMVTLFSAKFGSHYDKDVLKNRYKHLRRQYNDIKILLGQSGFSYDETREMVTAEEYVWDFYIKAHPDARSYRNKTLPSYHKLCVIYGQESSNGITNHLGFNEDIDGESPVLMTGNVQCHTDSDHSRPDWTPSMDRYLIDLMLKQVLIGNRIGITFNKQAWIDMVASFKESFGSRHDRDVLRSRHQSLRKLYHDMKNLLDHGGFLWDETQQMIIAYDYVWDAYIKEQPDVKLFRTETKPNYNDLCIIYGNLTSDGGSKHSDQSINGRGIQALGNCLRTDWTPQMDRYFIDLMLEQVRFGSMVDHKFNRQAWSDMVAKLNATFGSQHDKDVLKSRFKNLRNLFNDMKILLDQSGFVWDEMRQMVTADDDLWDAYIKVLFLIQIFNRNFFTVLVAYLQYMQEHPDAQSYRTRTLPNYNDLFLIYGNATTNGMHYHSSNCVDVDDYVTGANGGEEDDQSPASNDPLMTDWAKPMDQYFIDLLSEQVYRGNKIGHTFNEQAWSCMTTSFDKKFGLQCDKYVLENRYLSLMKEHNDINNLLNQKGFVWDETQQRVIAADDVWEAYIKEHPDVIIYRGRTLWRYNDLCMIFGHGISDGRLSHVDLEMDIDHNAPEIEMDELFGLLQSPARDIEIPDRRKKRQSGSLLTSAHSRKAQKTSKEGMQEAFSELAAVVTTFVDETEDKNYSSIETIVDALQTIPDLDDELFFDACELLEDEKKAETFVALDVTKRKKWLLRKLHC
ncbi:hypothetical protein L1049_020979 [Liquidambar formosana]|uniref:L10-interacting MYB domain-containing protein n=1 Tax=Liquidambar formosana TaxID=63359 RepID=A0AAP0SDX0_LIQFO